MSESNLAPKFGGKRRRWHILLWSGVFFISYFLIHLWLIMAFSSSLACTPLPTSPALSLCLEAGVWGDVWPAIYGPLSIAICTSLLIFSFGMFLDETIDHISVAYPWGYIGQFLIFVAGLTLVQWTGHAEIALNDGKWGLFSDQHPFWANVIKFVSVLGFPAMAFTLMFIEKHQHRILDHIESQLGKVETGHRKDVVTGFVAWVTVVFVVCVKTIALFADRLWPTNTHVALEAIYVVALAVEALFALLVLFRQFRGNRTADRGKPSTGMPT